jgi:hypothetical protein
MPVENTRKREKKYSSEPMEVKQYGPARYGSAQADASSAARAAQQRGNTRTTQQKVKEIYNSPVGQKVQQFYNALTSEKKNSSEAKPAETKKKKDPNRFKAISDRANAKRTDEQKAAIEKNNNKIYWQHKERMNNSGSYKAMMQSRTKGAMQKASEKNLNGVDNISNIKGEKKNSAYKQYEKAFGKKGR